METIKKLLIFVSCFTFLYVGLQVIFTGPRETLVDNAESVSRLYAIISTIFSIISAFVIQGQWSRWDRLENAMRGEADSLWSLLIYSKQLPKKNGFEIKQSIYNYTNTLVNEKWRAIDAGKRSKAMESAVRDLQEKIFTSTKDYPQYAGLASSIFLGVVNGRNDRLHYSTGHLPPLLYALVCLITTLIIVLSFFILLPNIWLDYLFTISIASLAVFIFFVIEDLNHPFRPGTWHVSRRPYKKLLQQIKES